MKLMIEEWGILEERGLVNGCEVMGMGGYINGV